MDHGSICKGSGGLSKPTALNFVREESIVARDHRRKIVTRKEPETGA
ncbi:hypothetical protein PF008_g16599 [Phytophthora fragariae]|uniref:Uncharacterized protein n=1 Tax=Phytophthora fragariae TaxID=53985 RepID=A0A6G0RAN7_9STRA|nr:hypothetical protein PF008_g16599 [Phytophthora fragariae]